MTKKIISYSVSTLLLALSIAVYFSPNILNILFGKPAGGIGDIGSGLNAIVLIILFFATGLIIFFWTIFDGYSSKIPSWTPIAVSILAFVIVRNDIGFNFFGSKTLIYVGCLILFIIGIVGILGNVLRSLLKWFK